MSSWPQSELVLHMQAWAGSWAANRHSWGTAGFRQGVPGRSERAERSPGENLPRGKPVSTALVSHYLFR